MKEIVNYTLFCCSINQYKTLEPSTVSQTSYFATALTAMALAALTNIWSFIFNVINYFLFPIRQVFFYGLIIAPVFKQGPFAKILFMQSVMTFPDHIFNWLKQSTKPEF